MYAGMKGATSASFVQEIWFEGVPAWEVWYEGVKLYPDDNVVVNKVVLAIDEDEMGIYWQHACAAASDKSVASVELQMELGGYTFALGRQVEGMPFVSIGEGGVLVLPPGVNVPLHECVGATARIHAVVPERKGAARKSKLKNNYRYKEGYEWTLPLLPGSFIVVDGYKGQKEETAYWNNISVKGLPSEHLYFDDERIAVGEKGRYNVLRKLEVSTVEPGDTGMYAEFNAYGAAGWKGGFYPLYPAFERVWELEVRGVTLRA